MLDLFNSAKSQEACQFRLHVLDFSLETEQKLIMLYL
jgi:hypothetical protein